ncbi:M28 family peptidase [Bacteroidota bacterium]
MKSIRSFICLMAITICLPHFSFAQNDKEQEFMSVFHSITSQELYNYVAELSDDKYEGRLSGTPEFMEAAKYVASKLKEWGIAPKGDNGSYFQYFDLPYNEVKNTGELQLFFETEDGAKIRKKYYFPDDYFPGTNSGNGTINAEVVYVGHGMTAPELNYDDYKGMDVKGKIVMIDRDVPYSTRGEDYAKWVKYTYHQYKLNNAVKHGAAGLVYVGTGANPNTSYNKELVYCHISPEVADDIFAGTGKKYSELKKMMMEKCKPVSFATGKHISITANTNYHPEGIGCNVIGMIEGTDPVLKNEVIIIGGHLDGVGKPGEIIPAAWDNATGIADIMAAARALASSPVKLKRSIMFIFIGGEESGLIGSQKYCQEPKMPKEKTVCFFNLDMVGTGTGLSVGGGQSYPEILKSFENANNKYLHRTMRSSKSRKSTGRPRSDGVIFSWAGYRTLSIGTTGQAAHKTYYHHPGDTKETIEPEIMEDVAKLIFVGLTNMANTVDLKLGTEN